MNKKVFLGALILSLIMSTAALTGCDNIRYKNNSKSLNKTTIGEASINNINKYTAIGVGKLDKLSPNKKYRLITDQNNDEEDEPDYSDMSNTLIGLTTEGVLEELSLTIQSGQQLNSSSFNITYYQEIGDFVLVSVLPADVTTYVSGVVGYDEYGIGNDRVYKNPHREGVKYAISCMHYPLKYSIRYYDSADKEYKYIDTSYLIHKRSGKIFPFSSRRYCVDIKKCINGEFASPTIIIEDETTDNYPINRIIEFYNDEYLHVYSDYNFELGKVVFSHDTSTNYNDFFDDNFGFVYSQNSFPNGFKIRCSASLDIALKRRWNNRRDDRMSYFSTIIFNEETSSLEITSLKVVHDDSDENNNVSNVCDHIDRFGNICCFYRNQLVVYNAFTKTFKKCSRECGFDKWSKQHYYFDTEQNNSGAFTECVIFMNKDFEEDYRIARNALNYHSTLDRINVEHEWYSDCLLCDDGFYERARQIDTRNCLIKEKNTYLIYSLDENYHYTTLPPTIVFQFSGTHIGEYQNTIYYMNNLIVHKVEFTSNYSNYTDVVLASLEDYPFIDEIDLYYDVVHFKGIDNSLNVIEGYVNPDGTISFELQEFEVDSSTTTLSPIN